MISFPYLHIYIIFNWITSNHKEGQLTLPRYVCISKLGSSSFSFFFHCKKKKGQVSFLNVISSSVHGIIIHRFTLFSINNILSKDFIPVLVLTISTWVSMLTCAELWSFLVVIPWREHIHSCILGKLPNTMYKAQFMLKFSDFTSL